MGSARVRTIRFLLLGLGLAATCALIGWSVFAGTVERVKEWDVDARGPVLVSGDGRTLTLAGVPDPAWSPGECFGNLSAQVVTEEHATAVAVHFHLRSVARGPGGPAGVCARFTGIRVDLAHPLGARTLTDAHGHPLRAVSEANLPRPHDPGLVEDHSVLCVAAAQLAWDAACPGSMTLVRYYRDASQQPSWTLFQSLDIAVPAPAPTGTQWVAHAVLDGATAVCGPNGHGAVTVDWTEAGTAQQLVLDSRSGPVATPGRLCARAIAEARTVR